MHISLHVFGWPFARTKSASHRGGRGHVDNLGSHAHAAALRTGLSNIFHVLLCAAAFFFLSLFAAFFSFGATHCLPPLSVRPAAVLPPGAAAEFKGATSGVRRGKRVGPPLRPGPQSERRRRGRGQHGALLRSSSRFGLRRFGAASRGEVSRRRWRRRPC